MSVELVFANPLCLETRQKTVGVTLVTVTQLYFKGSNLDLDLDVHLWVT